MPLTSSAGFPHWSSGKQAYVSGAVPHVSESTASNAATRCAQALIGDCGVQARRNANAHKRSVFFMVVYVFLVRWKLPDEIWDEPPSNEPVPE